MIIALDINEVRPYTLESDTTEPKTVFQVGVLDGVLLSAIEDSQTQFGVSNTGDKGSPDISVNLHGKNVEAVKFGLKGWENFKDKNGNDVLFTTQNYTVPRVGVRAGVSRDSLSRLNKDVIAELATEILKASSFDKEQEKN